MDQENHPTKNPRGSSPHTDEELVTASRVRRRPARPASKDNTVNSGTDAQPAAESKEKEQA